MTDPQQAAEDLLRYLNEPGWEGWDGYGVAEVAEILKPLAEAYLAQNPLPPPKPKKKAKPKKSSAKKVAKALSEQFMRNRQFTGQQ